MSLVLIGLSIGTLLFLLAAGLTLVFGMLGVVNFAHGALYMLGAYVAWSVLLLLPRDPLSFSVGIVLASVAVGAIGIAVEMLLLRHSGHRGNHPSDLGRQLQGDERAARTVRHH